VSLHHPTEPVMTKLQAFRDSFMSSVGLRTSPPDVATLRELCFALLIDVPVSDRKAMLEQLERMRRRDDLWHLRGALFDTISRFHGEAVARSRIDELDERLG